MKDEIYRTIPHRPPFLFLDEIVETGPDHLIARRTFRAEEFYYEGHYPGNPITPGVILCESVFQAAAVYLVKRMEAEGKSAADLTPVLARIQDAKFKQMVKPGDTVQIEVKMGETHGGFHFLRGTVRREGKVALALEFALALVDEKK